MQKSTIPYTTTGILNSLIQDYIDGKESALSFVANPFDFNSFEKIIENKAAQYSNRALLHKEFQLQYETFEKKEAVEKNIALLQNENCFSITTAHQSNIFTGPLYSIYKAVSAINTCKLLKEKFPDKDFVPIFWQGSEDHDFEEVNHTYLFDNKLEWEQNHKGEAVGRMNSQGFGELKQTLKELLGDRPFATELNDLIDSAYNGENNLAKAYKHIMHHLLGDFGLLVLNQDSKNLKQAFIPVIKAELSDKIVEVNVLPQIKKLEAKNYKVQATPREINLFYIDAQNIRNRIVQNGEAYEVLNTSVKWESQAVLFNEIDEFPERFSPNVFLRPVYQEQILPNLAYVGGQGELSYWMELKELFNANNTPFPMLVLRNMLGIVNSSTCKKINKLELSQNELFLDEETIIKRFVKNQSDNPLELNAEKEAFEKLYAGIKKKAASVDPTLEASVESILQGQLNALNNIESKILRAEKKNFDIAQNQIRSVKNALFPNGGLQERSENFMHFYSVFGDKFISDLIQSLNPFDKAFYLLRDD